MTVLLNNSLTKATGDDRYLKLDGSNANTNIDIGAYTLTATSVIETTPTLYKLDQTTPQTVVPIAGTTFRLGYGDLIGDGTSLVFPRLEMTNSNVVEFPQTMGAIKDGLFIHGETDNTPILVFGGADVLSYKLGAVSYDTTDGVITINPDATADEHAYVSVQAITSPSGDAFPLLSGTGSTDEGLFFSNLLGIWDKEDTGQVGIVAVSNDWSSTSYMLVWNSATEVLSYGGEGGFRVSTDGATAGTTATALNLTFKSLGDGADNDGIRIAFGHRSDAGILGTSYTAGYIDCVQTDASEGAMDSYLSFGGYTDGASGEWLRIDGTNGVDLGTLSLDTSGTIECGTVQTNNYRNLAGTKSIIWSTDRWYTNEIFVINNTMTIASGSITDSSGAISFGNENLSTTGTGSFGHGTKIGNATDYWTTSELDFGGAGKLPMLSAVGTFALGSTVGAIQDYLVIYDHSDSGYATLAFSMNSLASTASIQFDGTDIAVDKTLRSNGDDNYNIGTSDDRWKDGWFSGKIYFGDSGTYISQLTDGHLDLTGDVSIDLNSPLTRVTGDLYVGNNAAADPVIVFDGDTSNGQIKYYEDEEYFYVDKPVRVPYLGAAPSTLVNGLIWMESDGLHIYYNSAEKVVAGA